MSKNCCIIYPVSLIKHILEVKVFYRFSWFDRCSCVWCWKNTHFNITFNFLLCTNPAALYSFSVLSKYFIFNLHNLGLYFPINLKCSDKLLSWMMDFNTLNWSPNECGFKIVLIYVVTWTFFTIVRILCLNLILLLSDTCTETLFCISLIIPWSEKIVNHLVYVDCFGCKYWMGQTQIQL